MATKKRNLIKEAIQDAEKVKKVAKKNAEHIMFEHFKESLKDQLDKVTSKVLNESDAEQVSETGYGDDETVVEESMKEDQDQHDNMAEASEEDEDEDTMAEDDMDGLDLDVDEDEDMDLDLGLEGGDELEEAVGFTAEDIQEALETAFISEVEHASDSDPEMVDTDVHDTGVLDADKKEEGWNLKTAPAKKDWTVRESSYQKKIAKLVAENKEFERANKVLRKQLGDINLFNAKLLFANKLLNKPGLKESVKRQIVKAMDKAKSVQDVKSLYENFNVVLGSLSEGKTENKGKLPTLSETLDYPNSKGKGLSEVKDGHLFDVKQKYTIERFKTLAGLTKDE